MPSPTLEDRNVARRRTTRRIAKVLLGLIALLLAGFFWQLFGPNPPITVSRETTYITEPLGEDGLPDYRRYLIEQMSEGVTPENDGARLFWKAVWPGELNPEQQALVAAEFGFDPTTVQDRQFCGPLAATVFKSIKRWLGDASLFPEYRGDDDEAENLIYAASRSPWKRADLPPLADWLQEQQGTLDLLVEALSRPEWLSITTVSRSDSQADPFGGMIPEIGMYRHVTAALQTRGNRSLGDSNPHAAWRDCGAIYQLAGHLCREPTLLGRLIGVDLMGKAHELTLNLLDRRDIDQELLESIEAQLVASEAILDGMRGLPFGERILNIEMVHSFHRSASAAEELSWIDLPQGIVWLADATCVDWNTTLATINRELDLYDAAMLAPTWIKRQALASAIKVRSDDSYGMGGRTARSLLSPHARGELLGEVLADTDSSFLIVADVQTRSEEQHQHLRIALKLAEVRNAEGEYPPTLASIDAALLTDKLQAKPLVYQRTEDGYLLYSVGANGRDDEASCEGGIWGGEKFSGYSMEYWMIAEPMEIAEPFESPALTEGDDLFLAPDRAGAEDHPRYQQIPAGADDISLRLPVWHKPWPVRVEEK